MRRRQQTQSSRIVQDPAVMVGKPVVAGTRIPVERVIDHLAQSPDIAELFVAYPELTTDDVKACLQYAHRAVVTRTRETAGASLVRLAQVHGKGPVDLSSRVDDELYGEDT